MRVFEALVIEISLCRYIFMQSNLQPPAIRRNAGEQFKKRMFNGFLIYNCYFSAFYFTLSTRLSNSITKEESSCFELVHKIYWATNIVRYVYDIVIRIIMVLQHLQL